MKIGKPFRELTFPEYLHYIDNYGKCTDFNTLGLYRSILENKQLTPDEKVAVRDYAHKQFQKTFEFLQLKDPHLYIQLSLLGRTVTTGDEQQAWREVQKAQQRILAEKKIKHRNFGVYSKHLCGYENCPHNGRMVRRGSSVCEWEMGFDSDKSRLGKRERSQQQRNSRKNKREIIRGELLP